MFVLAVLGKGLVDEGGCWMRLRGLKRPEGAEVIGLRPPTCPELDAVGPPSPSAPRLTPPDLAL